MAATNNPTFTSFTVTQPFLGAPLQFQPALGSKELEDLIDSYIVGSASKQAKLSEVTIDFYNHATVDLNTGALVRRYDVFPSPWAWHALEQTPTQSQSSGFSPTIFTPSPGSSATFADSGYGSVSLTPPNRNQEERVSKRQKKDTKKAAEVTLPGFSIMTKDGVDVTSSAGRGTKTREQREHAHLMRILKACHDCKRKKIRVSRLYSLDIRDPEANGVCSAILRIGDNRTICQEPRLLLQTPLPLAASIPVLQAQQRHRLTEVRMFLKTASPPSVLRAPSMISSSFQKTLPLGTQPTYPSPNMKRKTLI